jgi:hypothetical protein
VTPRAQRRSTDTSSSVYDAARPAPQHGVRIYWTCLAVYGTHGLTKQGTESATSAKGFYASDIIQNIVTRTAPSLTIGEIEATTFVIPQCAFLDPVTGETAIQFVNAYHGFDWGVYDDRKFFYRSSDPDRLTWQARLSDGARLDLEGDTAEQIFNGVYVTYQDPSGQKKTVGPPGATADATDASLADTSARTPSTRGASPRWGMLEISQVTTQAGAIQLGAIWLAEHAAPQRRGTLTLTGTVTHPSEGDRCPCGGSAPATTSRSRTTRRRAPSDHRDALHARGRQIVCNLDNTPYMLDALLQRFGAAWSACSSTDGWHAGNARRAGTPEPKPRGNGCCASRRWPRSSTSSYSGAGTSRSECSS